jgi:hypothetical protein
VGDIGEQRAHYDVLPVRGLDTDPLPTPTPEPGPIPDPLPDPQPLPDPPSRGPR